MINSDFQLLGVVLKANDAEIQKIIMKTISGMKTFELKGQNARKV